MSRGLDRQLLFFEEIDYLKYLSIVCELKKYFLSWNEEVNNDRFIEITNNKLTDKEVLQNLYKYCGVKLQKEYNVLDESKKIIGVLKLIDDGISIMQISIVSRITYNKIQRLKKGENSEAYSRSWEPRYKVYDD